MVTTTASMRSRAIWFAVAAMAFVGLLWLTVGPVISERKLSSLKGASQEEVIRVLGRPGEILNSHTWIYAWWPNQGWVEIAFDEQNRVREINDESVF